MCMYICTLQSLSSDRMHIICGVCKTPNMRVIIQKSEEATASLASMLAMLAMLMVYCHIGML